MIVVGGWPGRIVVGLNGRFGVRPADFAVGGEFDNPLLDDVDPGDETTEFVAVVQTLPASGTVVLDDFGGFQHTGAADGSYITAFELCTWAQGGPITVHAPDEEITTTFGGTAGTAPGATLVATASLLTGSASGATNVTADGVTLTAAASLLAGAASGTANATAPGALLQVVASLLAGSVSGDGSATASGVLLTAQAALVAGAASGSSPSTDFDWSAVRAVLTDRTAAFMAPSITAKHARRWQ